MQAWYQLKKEEVFETLRTTVSGLKSEAIPNLQNEYGKNALTEARRKSKLSILVAQLCWRL